MRKLFLAIIILLVFMQANVLAQPIGFDETECGIISNPNYHFENYYNPGHGGVIQHSSHRLFTTRVQTIRQTNPKYFIGLSEVYSYCK